MHREEVSPADLTWWEGIPTIAPAKAIEQCIDYGTPTHLIIQAVENARARGLILEEEEGALRAKLKARNEGA